MTQSETVKKEMLEKQFALYSQQYQAASAQLLSELAWDQKISIQQQRDHWYMQMQQTETELTALESAEKTRTQRTLEFEICLPEIDFRQPHQHFEYILSNIEQTTGGAALFLLQECYLMGGMWFVQRIKNVLNSSGRLRECPPVRISDDMRPDEFGVISRLAENFGISMNTMDWQQGAAQIVEYLCGEDVVRTKDVIFIEIHGWDELDRPDFVLQKFIDGFWKPLVRQLPMITDYEDFKFIAFITADDRIPCPCLPSSVCCNVEDFRPEQALELQLTTWTPDDVRELCQYSGRTREEITKMAEIIYRWSGGGFPQHVYTSLHDYLRDH